MFVSQEQESSSSLLYKCKIREIKNTHQSRNKTRKKKSTAASLERATNTASEMNKITPKNAKECNTCYALKTYVLPVAGSFILKYGLDVLTQCIQDILTLDLTGAFDEVDIYLP